MAKELLHEDFGEKIGGAKKDLWAARGLYVDDLLEMNEREAEKYVKKDNVWKKPNYQALIQSGESPDILYFKKVIRDSLNASPRFLRTDDTPEKRLSRQKEYIATVREIQSAVENVQTVKDALAAFENCMIRGGYCEWKSYGISGAYISATQKGRDNPVITDKLIKALYLRNELDFQRKIRSQAAKKQFGLPAEQKVPSGYAIRYNDGKNTYSKNNDWQPNTYYVTKGYSILKMNFASHDEALKWVQDFAKQRGGNGKKRFVPQQLASIQRTGPDYRHGRDVTGQDYLDAFAFRGGEFGNWLTQNDRRASLNMGFDALKDLATALQISEKDISYQGTLSIAFGARGSGNAAAHYEPLRKVINLTKMHGAGSLGHEWWHGLDDYLGKKFGAKRYLSDQPNLYPPFKKLLEVMKYKPETLEQAAKRAESQEALTRKQVERAMDNLVLSPIKYKGDDKAQAEYNALKKVYQEKALSPSQPPVIGKVKTDYYKGSIEMGEICEKDGGYWQSNVEMTARAFATYLMDKLPYRSDYLNGHAEHAIAPNFDKDGNPYLVYAYPRGEERKAINAAFDEIIEDLKRENILTHSEQPQTLEEIRPVAPIHAALESSPLNITEAEQLSLFGGDKPSVLGQLAVSKEQSKSTAEVKPLKSHEPEI